MCFSWTHGEDFTKSFLLVVFSTWSYFKMICFASVPNRQGHVQGTLRGTATHLTNTALPSNHLSFSHNAIQDTAPIEMMYQLAHASKSVEYLKKTPNKLTSLSSTEVVRTYIDDCLDLTSIEGSNTNTLTPFSSVEYNFTVTPKELFNIQQLDIESSDLNRLSSYNLALSLTGLNTQEALKTSKEDRWLLRNSLLSENLIINSNAFTQSKKLLGVNFLNSDSNAKNV